MNIGLSQDCLQGVFASQIIRWFIRKYISKLSIEMMSFFKTDFTRPSVPETWGNLVLENIWLPCSPFPKPFPKLEKRCQETSQQPNENVRIYRSWNWMKLILRTWQQKSILIWTPSAFYKWLRSYLQILSHHKLGGWWNLINVPFFSGYL